MKKIITIFALIILTSCANWTQKEIKKTGESNAASSRINSSEVNSKNIYKELDE